MRIPVTMTQLYGEKVELSPFTEKDITQSYLGWLNDRRVTQLSNQRVHIHDDASSKADLAAFFGNDNIFCSIRNVADGRAIGTITAYEIIDGQPHDIVYFSKSHA